MSKFEQFFGFQGVIPPQPVYTSPALIHAQLGVGSFLIGNGDRYFDCKNLTNVSDSKIELRTTSTKNIIATIAPSAFAGAPDTKFRRYLAYDENENRLYVLIGTGPTMLGYINGTTGAVTVVGLLSTGISGSGESGFMELSGAKIRIWHPDGFVHEFNKTGGAITSTPHPYPGMHLYVTKAGDLSVVTSQDETSRCQRIRAAGKFGLVGDPVVFFPATPLPVSYFSGNTVSTIGLDGAAVYVGENRIAVTQSSTALGQPVSGGVYTRDSFDRYVESLIRGMFP